MGKPLVEQMNIVSGFLPVDMQTGANSGDWVSLKHYNHCAIVGRNRIDTDVHILTNVIQTHQEAFPIEDNRTVIGQDFDTLEKHPVGIRPDLKDSEVAVPLSEEFGGVADLAWFQGTIRWVQSKLDDDLGIEIFAAQRSTDLCADCLAN